MNKLMFNENTSLFEIRKYFKHLNKKTTLGFVEWIEDNSPNNIELEIHPLDYVIEILKYMKLNYDIFGYELAVCEKYEVEKIVKPWFKDPVVKIEKKSRRIVSIKWHTDNEIMFLIVKKKEHLKLAERIAIEISNYIACKIKIRLSLNFY